MTCLCSNNTTSEILIPPFPIIQEVYAIYHLFLNGFDDIVEDVLKLTFVLVALSFFHQYPVTTKRLIGALVFFFVGYSIVNRISDQVGDVLSVQETFDDPFIERPLFGFVEHPVDLLDDLIEDSVKLSCLYSHTLIGQKIAGSLAKDVKFIKWSFIFGWPAQQYTQCDLFADQLGDRFQNFFS